MGDVLRLPARLSAPPPVVYRALTDEAELRVWLAEHAEASPDERRFAFWGPSTPQGDNGRQRLLAAEADLRLSSPGPSTASRPGSTSSRSPTRTGAPSSTSSRTACPRSRS